MKKTRRFPTLWMASALAVLLGATPAAAQVQTGSLLVRVSDESGAAVPGVAITISSPVLVAGQMLRQMRTAALAAAAEPPSFKGPTMFTRTKNAGATWELPRIVYDPGADNQTINNLDVIIPSVAGMILGSPHFQVR